MRAWNPIIITLFLTVSLVPALAQGKATTATPAEKVLEKVIGKGYVKPKWVSDGVWEHLQRDLLPLDHPIKPALDKIFEGHRVTESKASFIGAGFLFHDRTGRRRVIARHPKLIGYLVKTYLDTHKTHEEDGLIWLQRLQGARQFQDCIDRHGYNHIMKVPKKWLYPLPCNHPSRSPYPKGYALIVEDMGILPHLTNYKKYATDLTKEQLEAIFVMLTENRAFDCIHVFNIPFCKDGKIAFIDTEMLNSTTHPINYYKMTDRIPPHLRPYWEKLYKGKVKL